MKLRHAKCSICSGTLVRRKVTRFGAVAAFFGWAFLIPSGLLVVGVVTVIALGVYGATLPKEHAPELTAERRTQLRSALVELEVPDEVIGLALDGRSPSKAQILALTDEQYETFNQAYREAKYGPSGEPTLSSQRTISPQRAFVLLSTFSTPILFISAPAFLVGILLASRKYVLRCTSCSAAFPAA